MLIGTRTSAPPSPLVDPFGRSVRYLRLSVTDRCNLRCVYCMSEDMRFQPSTELLSLEELDRVARAFMRRGVRKLRITGGEPLVRRNILSLFESLSDTLRNGLLDELTLTTNGIRLPQMAEGLAAAGVRRINISLDTLDAARFAQFTRGGSLQAVLEGIAAAQAAGLSVKLNAVALRGSTEHEIHDLIAFAHGRNMALTLIETMPLGDTGMDRAEGFLSLAALRRQIEHRWSLTDLAERSGGPARYVRVAQTGGVLGFITPLTQHFCGDCNRVRVTAMGMLHTCLGHEDGTDLRALLRASASDNALQAAIASSIARKPEGHDFTIVGREQPVKLVRHMSVTGG
jgi:GTP 3',8-cyclase